MICLTSCSLGVIIFLDLVKDMIKKFQHGRGAFVLLDGSSNLVLIYRM